MTVLSNSLKTGVKILQCLEIKPIFHTKVLTLTFGTFFCSNPSVTVCFSVSVDQLNNLLESHQIFLASKLEATILTYWDYNLKTVWLLNNKIKKTIKNLNILYLIQRNLSHCLLSKSTKTPLLIARETELEQVTISICVPGHI